MVSMLHSATVASQMSLESPLTLCLPLYHCLCTYSWASGHIQQHSCQYLKCFWSAGNLWHSLGGDHDIHVASRLNPVLDTLYIAVSLPSQCIAFLCSVEPVECILAQLHPQMSVGIKDKLIMPHYAAILAQICQVGLQFGLDSFYKAVLRKEVFDHSIEVVIGVLEVCHERKECFGETQKPNGALITSDLPLSTYQLSQNSCMEQQR